jgi:hypothetical protein
MRTIVGVLALSLLAAAGTSAWLWTEWHAERELNAQLTARLEQLAAAPRNETVPAAMPAQSGAASPVPTASLPAQAPATEGPVRVVGTQEDWDAQRRRLFDDPRYRDAWREQQRLAYGRRRDNLIRLLGFTPEQADAVIDLTVERELAMSQKEPAPPDGEAEEAFQDKLRALLGEQQRARLEGYMESRASRMQVDQMRSQFAGADALRDDQIEPLIAALHVEHAQARKALDEYRESLRTTGDGGNFSQRYREREILEMEAMHRRMHDSAAAVLSPTQLELLDAVLKRQLERHQTELRLNRLKRKVAVQAESATD